jgi:hypothetical protein
LAEWVAFGHDGATLASVDAKSVFRIWDATSGRQLLRIDHPLDSVPDRPDPFGPTLFDFDGRRLVTVAVTGKVRVWDAAAGLLAWSVSWGGEDVGIDTIALSPDGRFLAAYGTPLRETETGATCEFGMRPPGRNSRRGPANWAAGRSSPSVPTAACWRVRDGRTTSGSTT